MTPQEIYTRLLKAGDQWADLDGKARMLEETQKTVLSQIALIHVNNGTSAASAEVKARADKSYREHVEAMVIARTEANKAKVRLDAAKAWFDAWRTQESTKRAEMHMAGAQA